MMTRGEFYYSGNGTWYTILHGGAPRDLSPECTYVHVEVLIGRDVGRLGIYLLPQDKFSGS